MSGAFAVDNSSASPAIGGGRYRSPRDCRSGHSLRIAVGDARSPTHHDNNLASCEYFTPRKVVRANTDDACSLCIGSSSFPGWFSGDESDNNADIVDWPRPHRSAWFGRQEIGPLPYSRPLRQITFITSSRVLPDDKICHYLETKPAEVAMAITNCSLTLSITTRSIGVEAYPTGGSLVRAHHANVTYSGLE